MGVLQNDKSLELLEHINTIAMNHSALSLGTMLKDEVWVANFERNPQKLPFDAEGDYFSLYTEIMGEVKADTFLLINAQDERKICEKLLPASTMGQEEMREGALMELDNIMIAALVTKYSNLFYRDMHGHVPNMQKHKLASLDNMLQEYATSDKTAFSYRAELASFKYDIHIHMMAFFDQSIVEPIEKFDMKKSFVGEKEKVVEENKGSFQGFFKKIFH